MSRVGRIANLLVVGLVASTVLRPGPAFAQSPSAEPPASQLPSVAPSPSADAVPVVGFAGSGEAPLLPLGPEWSVVVDRPVELQRADAVACGAGAVVLASGRDRRDRLRALVHISPDGQGWTLGGEIGRAAERDDWHTVLRLTRFRGATYAFGGDGPRLAVWRSTDCGRSWRRLTHRPAFHLGRTALGINGIEVAATADRMLIIGRQSGEELQRRRWAWMVEAGGTWRRIPARIGDEVQGGLTADARSFAGWRFEEPPDAFGEGHLVTSVDGRVWQSRGVVPGGQPAIVDAARDRFLVQDETTGPGIKTIHLLASPDGRVWTPIAHTQPTMQSSASAIWAEDGVLVWLVDVTDAFQETSWSWVAVSTDGGTTWTASAGWPGMRLAGLQCVAVGSAGIALVTSGERFDRFQIRTLPR